MGREIATKLKEMDGPLLPILHAFVEHFGHINNVMEVLPI